MLFYKKPGLRFIRRTGVAAFDFQLGDFTQDGTWHQLDLSSIIPRNAKLILIKMLYAAPAAGRFFGLRVYGETYAYNNWGIVTPVGGGQHENNFEIPITGEQSIEYYLPAAGSTTANLVIQGWKK